MTGLRTAAAVLLATACAAAADGSAVITIINANDPGVGFNDPTPATPVGGNTGTTVGAQRLQAFQYAATLWGALLDSSVEIRIQATFEPLDCVADSGTLGAAGPTSALADFPNAPIPDTWYAVALASRLAGHDLLPDTGAAEIQARFNSNVGTTGCLASTQWYYGLDNQHGDFDRPRLRPAPRVRPRPRLPDLRRPDDGRGVQRGLRRLREARPRRLRSAGTGTR